MVTVKSSIDAIFTSWLKKPIMLSIEKGHQIAEEWKNKILLK